MRKTIITIIATIVMVANVQGQRPQPPADMPHEIRETISSSLPRTQFITGTHMQVSIPMGRFEPFVKAGVGVRLNSQSLMVKHHHNITFSTRYGNLDRVTWGYGRKDTLTLNNPMFTRVLSARYGAKFSVNDNNIIKAGMFINNGGENFSGFIGYIRRENFSPRTSLDLWTMLQSGAHSDEGEVRQRFFTTNATGDGFRLRHASEDRGQVSGGIVLGLEAGANLRYRITDRLHLSLRGSIAHGRKFGEGVLPELANQTRVQASIGLEARFGANVPQLAPRQQRVRPTHRALPCPPGQMRHQRSWDRPSSVFNHPSGR